MRERRWKREEIKGLIAEALILGDDIEPFKENDKEQPGKERKKTRKIWILKTSRDNVSKIKGVQNVANKS